MMTMVLKGDPGKLEEHASRERDTMQEILASA
jgi:hypothetical protein